MNSNNLLFSLMIFWVLSMGFYIGDYYKKFYMDKNAAIGIFVVLSVLFFAVMMYDLFLKKEE